LSLLAEAKQRKLVQWALAYAAAAFAVVQGVDLVANKFGWPDSVGRVLIIAAFVGFFVALLLAWYHGERGAQKVSGTEFALLALLLAIGGGLAWRFGPANGETGSEPLSSVSTKSIAVLPFDNRSGDASQNYYADGLTDELTTTLVTGSVLRAEGRIRYTAELVSAITEKTLWADRFERDEKDILTLQSQVAQAITTAIEVRLSPTEATRLAAARTIEPRAFDEYLRGRALWNQRTEASVREALVHFQNATKIAPEFALGYTGVADSYIILAVWGFEPPRTVMPLAKAAAQHAIELDPGAGEPHASLGDIHFHYDWDWAASTREHELAVQLAPAFATAFQWAAEPLEVTRDYPAAITALRRAQDLDPLSMIARAQLGRVLARSGKREEAIAGLREAVALDPRFLRTRRELISQLLATNRNDEALTQARQLVALDPKDVASRAQLGLSLGRKGLAQEAKDLLAQLDSESKDHFVSSLERARIAAGLDDRAATLAYLEAAVAAREGNVPLLAMDGEFAFLGGDARFAAVLHAIGVGDFDEKEPVP
jgi:TolB-like protein